MNQYKYGPGGGGGGWYGGGAANSASDSSTTYRTYNGGGSGYVYTSSTAANYPSGCLLTSSYYLTEAETIAGNQTIPLYSGGTGTGNTGNGAIRITVIDIGSMPLRIKQNGIWVPGQTLYIKENGVWSEVDTKNVKDYIKTDSKIKNKYAWGKYEVTADSNTVFFIKDALKDESSYNHNLTNTGVTLSSNICKLGNSSLYLSGNTYIDTSLNMSLSGDFTVDWWGYQENGAQWPTVFELYNSSSTARGYFVHTIAGSDSSQRSVLCFGSSQSAFTASSQSSYLNKWVHYAMTKAGTLLTLYINGISAITLTPSTTLIPNAIRVGGVKNNYSTGGDYVGYIDNFRISNTVRWTSNFNPPKAGDYIPKQLISCIEDEKNNTYPNGDYAADGYYYERL